MTTPVTPLPSTAGGPAAEPPDADLTLPPGDELIVTTDDGAALAVTVAPPAAGSGARAAATVVLSHCWTGSRAVWAPVARRLVAAGHPVVLYDQRGHGASGVGADPFSVERLGDDLARVVEAVDARGGILAGHSMGGMSVMACACRHPGLLAARVRGLALVATTGFGLGRQALERAGQVVMRGPRGNRMMARRGVGWALVRSSFGRDAHRAHVHATQALFVATPAQVRDGCGAAMRAMDLRAALATVELPAVVVLGWRDRLIANHLTRETAGRLRGARLIELDGAGHMLPLERPGEVAGAIAGLAR